MLEAEFYENQNSTNVRFWNSIDFSTKLTLVGVRSFFRILGTVSPTLGAKLAWRKFSSPRNQSLEPRGVFTQSPSYVDQKINGETIRVFQFGRENSKTVLLVHGWDGAATHFYKLVPELVAAGYKVITFDGPAHGASTGKSTNAPEFARTIAELSHRYGEFDAIIGHSFGGFASSMAIAKYSEVMGKPKLVTIGTPNRLKTMIHAFTNVISLPADATKIMKSNIEKKFDISIPEISTANFIKESKIESMTVHDYEDLLVSIKRAKEMHESTANLNLFTSGLGHNKILRSKTVINQIIHFLS